MFLLLGSSEDFVDEGYDVGDVDGAVGIEVTSGEDGRVGAAKYVVDKDDYVGDVNGAIIVGVALFVGCFGGELLELGVEILEALGEVVLDGLHGCCVVALEFPSCSALGLWGVVVGLGLGYLFCECVYLGGEGGEEVNGLGVAVEGAPFADDGFFEPFFLPECSYLFAHDFVVGVVEEKAVVGACGAEVAHIDWMGWVVTIGFVVAPEWSEVEFSVGVVLIDVDVGELLVASEDFAGYVPVDE